MELTPAFPVRFAMVLLTFRTKSIWCALVFLWTVGMSLDRVLPSR